MKKLLVLAGILVLLGSSGCATTPLPESGTVSAVKIIPPGPKVPLQIASYSGIWEGIWSNGRAVTIIIEEIESSGEVIAIYSSGSLYSSPGGWTRVIGRVKNGSIVLQWRGRTVTINMVGKNTVNAEYRRQDILHATLSRKK